MLRTDVRVIAEKTKKLLERVRDKLGISATIVMDIDSLAESEGQVPIYFDEWLLITVYWGRLFPSTPLQRICFDLSKVTYISATRHESAYQKETQIGVFENFQSVIESLINLYHQNLLSQAMESIDEEDLAQEVAVLD